MSVSFMLQPNRFHVDHPYELGLSLSWPNEPIETCQRRRQSEAIIQSDDDPQQQKAA